MHRRGLLAALISLAIAVPARAQDARVLQVELTPTRRAQIAIWIEQDDGAFVRTLALTQSVAYYGIGNRPGATQMNSGFHWPYGRREGVLPVWAHRRAEAPGAEPFRRVIFQNRTSEGWASRSASDYSRDDYFCLSFQASASDMDALDAVTCPSIFNSDKGRYLTEDDVARGYSEPFEMTAGSGTMMPLTIESLYPPRRDITRCTSTGCYDHADVASYRDDVRRAMPEIDEVTMATPPGETPMSLMFTVPNEWEDGEYVLFVEVNTEGDYNSAWGPDVYPTPENPSGAWDSWAINYGYAYRGQPSVVYRVPFTLTHAATMVTELTPFGYGSIDGRDGGVVHEMDGTITNDPVAQPGSGADRLMQGVASDRVTVRVIGPEVCNDNTAPEAVEGLSVTEYGDRKEAHRFAHMSFVAPADDFGIARYEVRVGTEPIIDEASFMRALQAQAATLENEALRVPTTARQGQTIEIDFGGLSPERHYYVAVRAIDICNAAGPMAVTEYTTPSIQFTTVSPCFVATAAWGTPMAGEIGALRRFRDRHLMTNAIGRAFVSAYYAVGPHLADVIREHDSLRSATRTVLEPLVALARWAD